MSRKARIVWRSACLLGLGLAVTACGGSGNPTPPTNGGGVVTVKQEDTFGMQFATAFRADNNSEPYNVADGDIVAISLTTEPVDIK